MTDARDWHEYQCAHGHQWWSAPTSTRCPVCNTSSYTPGDVVHGIVDCGQVWPVPPTSADKETA